MTYNRGILGGGREGEICLDDCSILPLYISALDQLFAAIFVTVALILEWAAQNVNARMLVCTACLGKAVAWGDYKNNAEFFHF